MFTFAHPSLVLLLQTASAPLPCRQALELLQLMIWRRERDSDSHHLQNHSRFAKLFHKSILSIRTKAEDYTRNTHAQTR